VSGKFFLKLAHVLGCDGASTRLNGKQGDAIAHGCGRSRGRQSLSGQGRDYLADTPLLGCGKILCCGEYVIVDGQSRAHHTSIIIHQITSVDFTGAQLDFLRVASLVAKLLMVSGLAVE
jgi:hypothetical protein